MAQSKSNEIRLTRIYDAPVQAAWDAWTDPAQAAHWWGPRGFTITTHSKELRPGGEWLYTMHGPDGVDYPNKSVYLEVEKHRKLVYDHGGNSDRPMFRVTVLFSEVQGRTQIEMCMTLPTPEAAVTTRAYIKKAGGDSHMDRLAEYLEKQASGRERFVINRTFDAPLDLMFELWTNPKHFSEWLPPTGATMEFIRADIRTGGGIFYAMTTAQGAKMYGRVRYSEIRKPDLLVYTQEFCDEKENIARHPMAATWPETMQTTVVLAEEEPGRTRVTVTWEPHGAVTREEIETFVKARAGMTMGWTGSFDKLDSLLEGRKASGQPL